MRLAVALGLTLVATACGSSYDGSTTCGRGRCLAGMKCISVFGDGRQNQGWNDARYPNVTNEWWCERPCPTPVSCAASCLQDPADEETIVCAVDHVDVVYYSGGKSCLCDAMHHCTTDQPVGGMDVIDTCASMHATLASCPPGVDCPAGTFHAGDAVPAVRLYNASLASELVYCPGLPSNHFGTSLPEGRTVRIYADENVCL